VLASPALADGALFGGADDGIFYAIEQKTGKLRWKVSTDGEFTGGATVADNGLILVGGGSGGKVCLLSPFAQEISS